MDGLLDVGPLVCNHRPVDDATLAVIDLRERSAERHALRPLLAPASIAVIGAGRQPGGVGHEVLLSLLKHGFTGPVYPINPNATEIAGCPAYPSLSALPQPVDLAVIAVPASTVDSVLADAGRAGVRAAVVLTLFSYRTVTGTSVTSSPNFTQAVNNSQSNSKPRARKRGNTISAARALKPFRPACVSATLRGNSQRTTVPNTTLCSRRR